MRISLESLKLELGIEGNLFECDYEIYGHLATDSWMKNVWEFGHRNSIIIGETTTSGMLLREEDKNLASVLEHATKIDVINKGEWRTMNRCRLYLNVITVADITTGNGKEIDINFWRGEKDIFRSRNVGWPDQGNPSKRDWATWRRILSVCLCKDDKRNLTNPLGRWNHKTAESTLTKWRWFWDDVSKELYEKHIGTWRKYQKLRNTSHRTRGNGGIFKNHSISNPADIKRLKRTSVQKMQGGIKTTGVHGDNIQINVEDEYNNNWTSSTKLKSLINDLKTERWAAREVMMTESIDDIIRSMKEGKALGVSDGSFQHKFGTACWIIENALGTERIIGLIDVPASSDDHDAYRSELAGLYGILRISTLLEKIGNIEKGSIEVGCDGKSALEQALSKDKSEVTSNQSHFDIISSIHDIKENSKITYIPVHIKGHQDDDSEAELDRYAHLNIECDLRAKGYLEEIRTGYKKPEHNMFGGIWKITICEEQIYTNFKKYLRKSISGTAIFDYWVNTKKRIDEDEIELIDWKIIGKAMKNTKHGRQQWISKFTSGWCATGKMMKTWGKRISSACPRCNTAIEDNNHILLCKAVEAVKVWDESKSKLNDYLDYTNTCPDLALLIINIIDNWKRGTEIQIQEGDLFDGIKELFRAQKRVGWRLFLDGCLTYQWAMIQQKYYEWKGYRNTGNKWASGLIRKLWDMQWDAWNHRNSMIHDTPLANIMEGELSLDRSLRNEWARGFVNFPRIIVAAILKEISTVMEGNLSGKKGWFVLVRKTRENLNDRSTEDEFSSEKSRLRGWVGL